MAGGCNKFSFVDPGHIFGWNLMKLGMGPLFDIVYLQKWSNFEILSPLTDRNENWMKIFPEFFFCKSTPNGPKREKNGRRFCRPVGLRTEFEHFCR